MTLAHRFLPVTRPRAMPARARASKQLETTSIRLPARGRVAKPSRRYDATVVAALKRARRKPSARGKKGAGVAADGALTLADAERLWELVSDVQGPLVGATLRAIASGGGRGLGGAFAVEAEAARWLTMKTTAAHGEGSDEERSPKSGGGSGAKRNLSARFDPDAEGEDGEEATSASGRAGKRRRLTVMERVARGLSNAASAHELRYIDGHRYDKAVCAIVDESVERLGRVDVTCAKAVELSVTATGMGRGITPLGLETLRMIVAGGVGSHYKLNIDPDARKRLQALITAEEEQGPEVLMSVDKRRRLARALARLSNFGRAPQYRIIERTKYDEKICHIADVSMHRFNVVDLACARAMYASALDGGSYWGVTAVELKTLHLILEGGAGEHSYALTADAKKYLSEAVKKEDSRAAANEPSPSGTRMLSPLRKLVKRTKYRYIDGHKYLEEACALGEECMERVGRVDLACAREIHKSLDGGLLWGITSTEYATIRLILDGGRDDVLFICDDDARAYLLSVLGSSVREEAASVTPPTQVHVRKQAPESVLQSALKNPPPSASRNARSAKKKGVNFTPAKRFEMRTYVPSPSSGNSDEDDSSEEEERQDPTPVEEEEEEEEEFVVAAKPTPRHVVRLGGSVEIVQYFLHIWWTPVTVLDTIMACLITVGSLLLVHNLVIAYLIVSMTSVTIEVN